MGKSFLLCALISGASLGAPSLATAQASDRDPELSSPVVIPRTVSATRQFIIFHPEKGVRTAVARGAESLKENWLQMMGLRDEWRLPILIHATRPQGRTMVGDFSNLRVFTTTSGMQIEIDVVLNESFNPAEFARRVVEALFLELAYRDRPALKPGAQIAQLPTWLALGGTSYVRHESSTLPEDLFDHLIATDQLLTLRDFLEYQPVAPDETSTKIYSAYAYAFLRMLRELPAGKAGLIHFVKALPDARDLSPETLFRYFPALEREGSSLEKWWTLNLAKMSTVGDWRMLNPKETVERLADYLEVEILAPEEKSILIYPLEEWPVFIENPNTRRGLVILAERLGHLSVVCDPLFAPVINDYIQFTQQLYDGKPGKLLDQQKELNAQLARFQEIREILLKKREDITDYLNWYEATQVDEVSGAFEEYLRLTRAPLDHMRLRDDDLTRYMNQLEYQISIERETGEQQKTPRPHPRTIERPWQETRREM